MPGNMCHLDVKAVVTSDDDVFSRGVFKVGELKVHLSSPLNSQTALVEKLSEQTVKTPQIKRKHVRVTNYQNRC